MQEETVCMHCTDPDPDKPTPSCVGLRCHGYLSGCQCPACLVREDHARRRQGPTFVLLSRKERQ